MGAMKIGFIGLGKMGYRMSNKLLIEKHELIVWNRSPGPAEELLAEYRSRPSPKNSGLLSIAGNVTELIEQLDHPRVIWSMLPAGGPTEVMIKTLSDLVEPEDILIDGGNSYFKDTETRYNDLQARNIKFLGIGVSGGIVAEKQGYPLMAGGDKSAYEYIKPLLDSLAKPGGGHEYFGTGGAGHFVKMVHNGIEYGIMQSLGEGFEVLHKAPYNLVLAKVARLYQKGTLVSGFMLDRAVEVLEKDPELDDVMGIIAESGEAVWTITQAREEGVEVDIINSSLEYRRRSQTDAKVQESFTAKLVAALRNAFGGHEVQRK
jgi:6-phosphogluconate dehydrogenase